jgi:hypothetical protein
MASMPSRNAPHIRVKSWNRALFQNHTPVRIIRPNNKYSYDVYRERYVASDLKKVE